MIYTLTLNSAIDEFITGKKKYCFAGGKGVNVVRALKKFGVNAKAIAVIGGVTGRRWQRMADKEPFSTIILKVAGETRINITYCDKADLRDVGKGENLDEKDRDYILAKVQKLIKKRDWLVVSGSSPGGDLEFYHNIIKCCKSERLVLDLAGKALKQLIKYKPYLIKPNLEEAEECLGRKIVSEADIQKSVERLQHMGASNVVLSLGENGVAAYVAGVYYRCRILKKTNILNPLGCGDVLLAGFLAHLDDPVELALRKSVAAATAGALQLKPGYFLKRDSGRIERQIEVAKLA